MNKKPRFSREELSDAMFHDSSISTVVDYEMRKMIDKYPNVVEMLSQVKDGDNQYLFQARDINWIMYKCRETIAENPEKLQEVLNDPEKVKAVSGYALKYEGFARVLGSHVYSTEKRNEFAKAGKTAER